MDNDGSNNLNETPSPEQPTQNPQPVVGAQKQKKGGMNLIVIGIAAVVVVVGAIFGILVLSGNKDKNSGDNNDPKTDVTEKNNDSGNVIKANGFEIEYTLNNDYRFSLSEDLTEHNVQIYTSISPKAWDDYLLVFTGTLKIKSQEKKFNDTNQPIRFQLPEKYSGKAGMSYDDLFSTNLESNVSIRYMSLSFPEHFNRDIDFIATISINDEKISSLDYIPIDITFFDENYAKNGYSQTQHEQIKIYKKDIKSLD